MKKDELDKTLALGKARIVVVGRIENGQPRGFYFGGSTTIEAMNIGNEPRWGGWTLAELREVISRPDEFCDNENS